MNYEEIKNEIENDPLGLGYKIDGVRKTPTEILSIINTINSTSKKIESDVSTSKLLKWAAKTGALLRLEAAASDEYHPARSIALTATYILRGAISGIDMSDDDNIELITALVMGQVITSEEKDSLINLKYVPASRAEELFGRILTFDDIQRTN